MLVPLADRVISTFFSVTIGSRLTVATRLWQTALRCAPHAISRKAKRTSPASRLRPAPRLTRSQATNTFCSCSKTVLHLQHGPRYIEARASVARKQHRLNPLSRGFSLVWGRRFSLVWGRRFSFDITIYSNVCIHGRFLGLV